MTSDNSKENSAGSSNITSHEELAAALQKELGETTGYLDLKYREWCVEKPDEVYNFSTLFIAFYR